MMRLSEVTNDEWDEKGRRTINLKSVKEFPRKPDAAQHTWHVGALEAFPRDVSCCLGSHKKQIQSRLDARESIDSRTMQSADSEKREEERKGAEDGMQRDI